MKKSKSTLRNSRENLLRDSDDQSDGCDSTTSSSSSATTALKGIMRELERTNHVRSSSDGGRLLCGLGLSPRKSACLLALVAGP